MEWKEGSQVWKYMLENKDLVEQFLWWEPKGGNVSILFDNWTNLGSLFKHHSDTHTCYGIRDIGDFLAVDGWDFQIMQ